MSADTNLLQGELGDLPIYNDQTVKQYLIEFIQALSEEQNQTVPKNEAKND